MSATTTTTTTTTRQCTQKDCKKIGSLRCSRCKDVFYCSKECQKGNWKIHKKNCKAPTTTDAVKDQPTTSPGAKSKNPFEGKQDEYKDFFFNMMGMALGERSSVAQEYSKHFPRDQAHVKRIQSEEMVYRAQIMSEKSRMDIFDEEDFKGRENFVIRWGTCLRDADHLMKFLSAPGRKFGDIYERPSHPPFNNTVYQTMRNTSIANQVYEFGKTYVGFGFVDLFQIVWGQYQKSMSATLTFYGYDMNRITTLRSKLIYNIFKHFQESEISTMSVLQIWFSSCWDGPTSNAFQIMVKDALSNFEKYDLSMEDLVLLRKWKKAKISVFAAKKEFSKGLRNASFDDVWRMKTEEDRVKFMRYLFTGCIFVAEDDTTVCGNPTMFTEHDGKSKIKEELFFKAIDLLATGFDQSMITSNSLFEVITSLTHKTTMGFRVFVQMGKIVCHIKTKFVNTMDLKFAKQISQLQPYGIDWSNLPDYMEKKAFINFARACSVKDTIHQMHFLNWINYVYGACHVDWAYNQHHCVEMYNEFKKSHNATKEFAKILKGKDSLLHFFEGVAFINPLNSINILLSSMFRKHFEDYFLSDENGKLLNRFEATICDAAISSFFDQSPTMFRTTFSFDDNMVLQQMAT